MTETIMPSHALVRLFITWRGFVILVVLSLASSTLLSSSLILTSHIINIVISRELSRLPYHLIVYSYSDKTYVSSIRLLNALSTKLAHCTYISSSTAILAESRVVENIRVGNATINVSPIILVYVPGLNDTVLFPYGRVGERVASSNILKIGLRTNNTIGGVSFEAEVIFREEELRRRVVQAYGSIKKDYSIVSHDHSINPYSYVLDKLRVGLIDVHDWLIVLTGREELFSNLTNKTIDINLRFVKLKLDEIYYIGEQPFSKKNEIIGSVTFSILYLNIEEVSRGYGASYTINKIREILDELRDDIKPFHLCLIDDWAIIRLNNIRQGDQQFRLAVGITLLPIMFVVWIILTKTPSFLISLHRREIALLKIRGVSSKKVFEGLLQSVFIYATIGTLFGVLLSPVLPSLILMRGLSGETYVRDLKLIIDPSTIALIFGLTYIMYIGHLVNGMKIIATIKPLEFIRKTHENIHIERPSAIFYAMLVLTIYITLRFTILNPFKLLYSQQYGVLTQVVSTLLLVLEPIATLFGPVILVYTLSKAITSFPSVSLRLVSGIARLFTKKYHGLVAKFSRTKLGYLALAMVTSYFSLSLLFGSILALELTREVYERSGLAMHGGLDSIMYKPVSIHDYSDLLREAEQIIALLNNSDASYSIALLVLGYTPARGENIEYHSSTVIQEGGREVSLYRPIYLSTPSYDVPVSYILFIDDRFTEIIENIDELSYTKDFDRSLRTLLVTRDASIYVFNKKSEDIAKKQYFLNEPYAGEAVIKFGTKTLMHSRVLSSSRNIPLAAAMARAGLKGLSLYQTELPYSGLASLPIVTPIERGLIMRIDDFEKLVSETRSIGYKGSYFGYLLAFVKGQVTISKTDGVVTYHLGGLRSEIEKFTDTLCLSHKFTLFTSICLYIASLLVLSILAYSVASENTRPNALMIGRGISTADIYRLSITETLSLLTTCIAPGLIAGLMIGYGLSRISMQVFSLTEVTPIFVDEAYGVTPAFSMPLSVILAVIIAVAIPLAISITITSFSWRKALKESIRYLTGV